MASDITTGYDWIEYKHLLLLYYFHLFQACLLHPLLFSPLLSSLSSIFYFLATASPLLRFLGTACRIYTPTYSTDGTVSTHVLIIGTVPRSIALASCQHCSDQLMHYSRTAYSIGAIHCFACYCHSRSRSYLYRVGVCFTTCLL